MFLHLLNDTQQRAFLALAKQFVEADSKLSDDEHNLLELMYAEAGQDFDVELPEGDRARLLAAFPDRPDQIAVLLELIGVGHADSEFHGDESQFVREVAEAFELPTGEVEKLESWVTRQLALAQEAQQLLAG